MNLVLVLVLVLVLDFVFPRQRFRGPMRETFRRNLCRFFGEPPKVPDAFNRTPQMACLTVLADAD